MVFSNANPTENKALFSVFPIVTLALVSSTSLLSLWYDANNATGDAITGRNNNNSNANGGTSTASKETQDSNVAIYHQLGVKPPHNSSKAFKLGFGIELPLYRWAWNLHGRLLPLLHFFDNERPQDLFVNLKVLWCKLLISLDPDSPAYEGKRTATQDKEDSQLCNYNYATYRMLPPYSIKWALRYLGLWKLFPRWMHANIELRMVYLQTAMEKVLGSHLQLPKQDGIVSERICVILLGGGYDPWGTKLSARGKQSSSSSDNRIQRVYELDLPEVVDSKRRLLLRAGFNVVDDCNNTQNDDKDYNQGGDDCNQQEHGVRLEGVDLNNNIGVDRVLDKIRDELIAISESPNGHKNDVHFNASAITNDSNPPNGTIQWHVVLISEALLLYLDPGKAERILEGVAERFRGNPCNDQCAFKGASFVFADRLMRRNATAKSTAAARRARMSLPTSPDAIKAEKLEVQSWLRDRGWELNEILLKSGATRHLGIATTISPQ